MGGGGGGTCRHFRSRDAAESINGDEMEDQDVDPFEMDQAREVLDEVLAIDEGGDNVSSRKEKISLTVLVPGYGKQYKSTLVKLLNVNPHLSHDRLVRVRQKPFDEVNHTSVSNEDNAGITLFDDYAFCKEKKLLYGRVARMRKIGAAQGYVEYKKPISYSDKELSKTFIIMHVYLPSTEGEGRFIRSKKELEEVTADKIRSHINFVYDSVKQEYTANENEIKTVESSFALRFSRKNILS